MRVKERWPWSEATEGVWGNHSPINKKVPLGTKIEGEGAEAVERSDRRRLGKPFPNQTEGATGHKKMRVKTLIFFVPKAGLEPARLFKDIGF